MGVSITASLVWSLIRGAAIAGALWWVFAWISDRAVRIERERVNALIEGRNKDIDVQNEETTAFLAKIKAQRDEAVAKALASLKTEPGCQLTTDQADSLTRIK